MYIVLVTVCVVLMHLYINRNIKVETTELVP